MSYVAFLLCLDDFLMVSMIVLICGGFIYININIDDKISNDTINHYII